MLNERLNDSILLINKQAGYTSNDEISRLKKVLKIKKIGHAGTLDKAATGLLVVGTGKATKLLRYFIESDKKYIAEIQFGIVTDSCDSEGSIIEKNDISSLNEESVKKAVNSFTGKINQMPPVFSALKIKGQRASDLAREGKEVRLEPREINIYNINIINIDLTRGSLKIEVFCSKGTYIRSLARDIGERLDVGAYLTSLSRIESGFFSLNYAVSVLELDNITEESDFKFCLKSSDIFKNYSRIIVQETSEKKIKNGVKFTSSDIVEKIGQQSDFYAVYTEKQDLIAIAEVDFNNFDVRYLNVFNWQNYLKYY